MPMGTELICPRCWPCFEEEVGPETSRGPLQPKRVIDHAGSLPKSLFAPWKVPEGYGKQQENEGRCHKSLAALSTATSSQD